MDSDDGRGREVDAASSPSVANAMLMDLAFSEAADKGDIISLQDLIAVNPSIIYSTIGFQKNTALHIAASKGHTLFVHHFLLYVGRDMELMIRQNIDGDTPLHLAARAGHLEVVEHLIQYSVWAREMHANLQEPTIMANKAGNTPLHDALSRRHFDIALKLLEANPHQAVLSDIILLMDLAFSEAADKGDIISLQDLIAVNPSIIYSTIGFQKNTALHIAASKGHTLFVHHFLLYVGRDMELMIRQNIDGDTPLHLAARAGHLEVVEHLIQYLVWAREMHANLQEPTIMANKAGNTPLHDALSRRHFDIALKLLEANPHQAVLGDIILLMDLAFSEAADKGDIISLQDLIAVNPNIIYSTIGFQKNTALHIAASKGHTLFVHHFLLYVGRDMELMIRQNIDGDTPLHLAVRAGHLEVVEHLIQYSVWAREMHANLQEPTIMANKAGNTPLHDALSRRHFDIALKLLEANPHQAVLSDIILLMDRAISEAADKGDIISLRYLIAINPSIIYSTIGIQKNTALHIAASKGHTLFVHHFLLYVGRDMELMIRQNIDGDTPLHLAARAGHLEVVEHLIQYSVWAREMHANLQEPTIMANKEGNTPLHVAMFRRHFDIALKLLEVNLHQAVLGDNIWALEFILNNTVELVELTDSSGNNALHYAAWHNRTHMVSMLLNNNSALAYKKNIEEYTPLHMSAKYGSVEAAIELLKQCPDATDMVDLHGRNALHIAIINYKVSMLKLLLEHELPEETLNKQDNDGNTPLHHAAKLRQEQSILCLLDHPKIKSIVINKEGHTAWTYQIPFGLMPQALSNAIDEGNIVSLVNYLADFPQSLYSVTPIRGDTALHLAASKGSDWFVHCVLLYTNRNVGFIISKNINGDTPLHLAVRAGHLEVVDHLIHYVAWARKIEPNLNLKEPLIRKNRKGNTLLHEAAIHGRYHVADSLLRYAKKITWTNTEKSIECDEFADDVASISDALVIIRNDDWDTPLHLAAKEGDSEFVDMLIRCAKVMNLEPETQYAKGPIIMPNKLGNTPLHNALLHRKSDIALKLLEANPRCGHMLNAAMQSPFYIAVRDGLTYVVKKIADQGMYVASTSTHGTALHQSVLGDNIRALEILLNRYEELLELTDLSGNNALHYAAQENNPRMVSILLNKSSTLAYKQNRDGHTPLHRAAYYGSAEAAKVLLKQFPDAIEMVDYMGRNALHVAARNDKVNVLQLLLKYVLPEEIVNQQDRDGNTPLHHAAMLFRRQSTLLLLNDRRVNPCLVNRDGHSPFALTCRRGTSEMNFFEMNVWKELERHEFRRCKQHSLTRQEFRPLSRRNVPREMVQSMNRDILVATLMSVAPFAVTFKVPGGYNQHSGAAIFGHHRAFKILAICNTISMCSSTVVVLFYLFLLLWRVSVKLKLSMLNWVNALIVLSGLTMIMSMLTAVYLTTAPASRLVAYVVITIGAGTPLLACFILRGDLSRKSMFGSWIGHETGTSAGEHMLPG